MGRFEGISPRSTLFNELVSAVVVLAESETLVLVRLQRPVLSVVPLARAAAVTGLGCSSMSPAATWLWLPKTCTGRLYWHSCMCQCSRRTRLQLRQPPDL